MCIGEEPAAAKALAAELRARKWRRFMERQGDA
jgi:hypothetical protein